MQQLESRRYRVTAVLGEGGFGKVYRAQMVGSQGFVKDVAIKLLHDGNVPEESLKRFRDEARILGLVRDRAVVGVEPPIQLGGRWAVVMEFVDGASAKALLELGVFPAGVVAEIVREVARALDHVFHMEGPSGEALQLLHRDLKPENLQISRFGDVKILDFGTAKARFETREARTLNHIGGTLGYIAPERLEGIDGAAADVYSLGVMAHVLLTGRKPSRRDDPVDGEESVYGMLVDLAKQMRSPEPEDRPTARDVEEACARIHRQWEGATLRAWAEKAVPDATRLHKDGMVGHVLSETVAGVSLETSLSGLQPLPSKRPWLAWLLVAVLLGVLGVVAAGSVGTLSGVGIVLALLWPRTEIAPIGATPPPVVLEVGSVDVPVRVEVSPEEEPAPRGVRRVTARPEPAVATWALTFTSVPAGATVYVDGRVIGETPQVDVRIPEGAHSIRMVSDQDATSQRITVGRLKPTRYVWKGGNTWLSYSN